MTKEQQALVQNKLKTIQSLGYRVQLNSQQETQPYKDGLTIMELADYLIEALIAIEKEQCAPST